jgi:thiamine biosynthesis lipoprotein
VKDWRTLMGMPVTVEIVGDGVDPRHFARLFAHFDHFDRVFSPFRPASETSRVNHGLLRIEDASEDMRTIVSLSEKTRTESGGYFDVYRDGVFDPGVIVKGWAVYQASEMLRAAGVCDFFIAAGGDIQLSGRNQAGDSWVVGIRNPFHDGEIVKILRLSDAGIATAGPHEWARHAHDPLQQGGRVFDEIASLTVIGPNAYEADRFATAAFAMGRDGIAFIERDPILEGYMIDRNGVATFTRGFSGYTTDVACTTGVVCSRGPFNSRRLVA